MIENLPLAIENAWLSRADATSIVREPFPLHEVLRESLYYPSCGFDGDPVQFLGGNVLSFVYVDYGKTRAELDAALSIGGFSGYEAIATRSVGVGELAPNGWTPSEPLPGDGDPGRFRDAMKQPFCSWSILQRRQNYPPRHGPSRFSLLYLCADGVAAFQALYVANGITPSVVAIIQPGHGFGRNWTNYEDPRQIFARSVLQNPAGMPRVLLYGGIGKTEFYREPCWPNYAQRVCFLRKTGGGTIGVWRQT